MLVELLVRTVERAMLRPMAPRSSVPSRLPRSRRSPDAIASRHVLRRTDLREVAQRWRGVHRQPDA